MKKLASLGALALIALVAVLAIVGVTSPAQAYPERKFDLTANRTVLYGGQTFTATADSNVHCDWTLSWNGDSRQASRNPNGPFHTTYTAPNVSEVTKIPLSGSCAYDAEEKPVEANFRAAVTPAVWTQKIIITVLPRNAAVSPPGGGSLPGTGGPDLRVLVGGLVLILSGATAVIIARRRAEEAEVRASQA
jgi:hypothetical protein